MSRYGDPTFADYPVLWASWTDAIDYFAWVGKRLPTESEWVKAARGRRDVRIFPCGDTRPDCMLANYYLGVGTGACVLDTTPVGSYPQSAGLFGMMGMAGNVWERVSDWYEREYYDTYQTERLPANPAGPASGHDKEIRGGSYETNWVFMTVYRRDMLSTDAKNIYNGIRCGPSP